MFVYTELSFFCLAATNLKKITLSPTILTRVHTEGHFFKNLAEDL